MSVSMLLMIVSALMVIAGIIGAVVQVWPSGPLVGGGILLWAFTVNTSVAWWTFACAALVLLGAFVAKYVLPGRKLMNSGIPHSTLIGGLVGAVVGFFLIPVVGFIIGMVVAIYAMEYLRLQSTQQAWDTTLQALKIVGMSIVIELLAALFATSAWIVGLVMTANAATVA